MSPTPCNYCQQPLGRLRRRPGNQRLKLGQVLHLRKCQAFRRSPWNHPGTQEKAGKALRCHLVKETPGPVDSSPWLPSAQAPDSHNAAQRSHSTGPVSKELIKSFIQRLRAPCAKQRSAGPLASRNLYARSRDRKLCCWDSRRVMDKPADAS